MAAIALTHHRLYPSASRIAELLSDHNVMRSRTARAAWREVLGELAWQRDRAAGVADDELTVLATSPASREAPNPHLFCRSIKGSGSPTAARTCQHKP
jgi:hypothetical protein